MKINKTKFIGASAAICLGACAMDQEIYRDAHWGKQPNCSQNIANNYEIRLRPSFEISEKPEILMSLLFTNRNQLGETFEYKDKFALYPCKFIKVQGDVAKLKEYVFGKKIFGIVTLEPQTPKPFVLAEKAYSIIDNQKTEIVRFCFVMYEAKQQTDYSLLGLFN